MQIFLLSAGATLLVTLVVLVVVWGLISKFGGWATLAKVYRCETLIDGEARRFCSISIGIVNYGLVTTLQPSETGLGMSQPFPLRVGHPDLLIPWSDIHLRPAKLALFAVSPVRVCVGDPDAPVVRMMLLPAWVREYLLDESATPDDAEH